MVCVNCRKSQEDGEIAYYKWGTVDIGIIACKRHIKEISDVLNDYQKLLLKIEVAQGFIPRPEEPNYMMSHKNLSKCDFCHDRECQDCEDFSNFNTTMYDDEELDNADD